MKKSENMQSNAGIRELSDAEINAVSGGIVPVIGAVVSAIGHFTARTALTSYAGRVGFGVGVYELAKWVDQK